MANLIDQIWQALQTDKTPEQIADDVRAVIDGKRLTEEIERLLLFILNPDLGRIS